MEEVIGLLALPLVIMLVFIVVTERFLAALVYASDLIRELRE